MADNVVESVLSSLQGLVSYPREELNIELKSWLDIWTNNIVSKEQQADLGHAILALANHGGGYVLIGFQEINGTWEPDTQRPADTNGYTQDKINSIIARYAEPVFHCSVHHVTHPLTNEIYPVVIVPSDLKVPVRSKRDGPNNKHIQQNCYYIRRPGPCSEQVQTAQEWDHLINRCIRMAKEDLLDSIRALLIGGVIDPDTRSKVNEDELSTWVDLAKTRFQSLRDSLTESENPHRYDHGFWTFAYSIEGDYDHSELVDLLSIMREVDSVSGWPVFITLSRADVQPYPVGDLIECWLRSAKEPVSCYSDFWQASPTGRFFMLRGFKEDCVSAVAAGKVLDQILPIWYFGECMLHAGSMAEKLGATNARISVRASWTGLKGRELCNLADPLCVFCPPENNMCRTDTIESAVQTSPELIATTLPEIMSQLLRPLYTAFGFFKMSPEMYEYQLKQLKSRRS